MENTAKWTNNHEARDGNIETTMRGSESLGVRFQSNNLPFAGRLGANQACIIDGTTTEQVKLLKHQPDATPHMSFRELIDIRPIKDVDLWKAALIEAIGGLSSSLSSTIS